MCIVDYTTRLRFCFSEYCADSWLTAERSNHLRQAEHSCRVVSKDDPKPFVKLEQGHDANRIWESSLASQDGGLGGCDCTASRIRMPCNMYVVDLQLATSLLPQLLLVLLALPDSTHAASGVSSIKQALDGWRKAAPPANAIG